MILLTVSLSCAWAKAPLNLASRSNFNHHRDVDTNSKLLRLRGGNADWRYFVAGGGAAAISHGITTPIDVVKTKMQGNPSKYRGMSLLSASQNIIKEFGMFFLLAGLGPTFVGYGLEGGLKFGAYESFKVIFANLWATPFYNLLTASVVAGSIAAIILCPMEEVRIKMVEKSSWKHETLLSGLLRIVKEHGLLSPFAGLPAMLSKQVPYTMGKQVSFDLISRTMRKLIATMFGEERVGDLAWLVSVCSAFVTSIIACICSQPGDMILTATYKAGRGEKKDFLSVARRIHDQGGLAGFFLGLQARLAHVAVIITTQLTAYDGVKALLGLPVTGAH
jgi:solute carrier family 25 phosphate transporter 3